MPTVAYASFCCPKDIGRVVERYGDHLASHRHAFDDHFIVFQRCNLGPVLIQLKSDSHFIRNLWIRAQDYPDILGSFGIPHKDPRYSELTHGWTAPHYYEHHLVNHLRVLQCANTDYIVFADGDCFIKDTPDSGPSWVAEGIRILECDPKAFVVCPSDGGPGRLESIMSQQMFLIRRLDFLNMTFIPWDGKFIDGGPFQEYYALCEGFIARFMAANGLYRVVLPPRWRYWHLEFH